MPAITAPGATATGLPELVDVRSILQATIRDSIVTMFNEKAGATSGDLIAALDNQSRAVGGYTATVDVLSGGFLGSANEMAFRLVVHAVGAQTRQLDLGPDADAYGIDAGASIAIDAQVDLQLDFTFGYDVSATASGLASFFAQVNGVSAAVAGDAMNINVSARVGMLSASVVGGSVSMDTHLAATVNGGERVSLAELDGRPASNLIDVTMWAEALTGQLPIDATLAGLIIPQMDGRPITTLAVGWDHDEGGGVRLSHNQAFVDLLSPFEQLTPHAAAAAFNQLSSWLARSNRKVFSARHCR